MSQPLADRNLLFGLLALQMSFISRDDLVEAMKVWAENRHRSLGEILCELNAINDHERNLLESLVNRHVEKHDNDPQKSLGTLTLANADRSVLDTLDEVNLHESLSLIGQAANVPDPAQTASPGSDSNAVPIRRIGSDLRYEILRSHARGGLGEIFVARDRELQREVALKEIQTQHADHSMSRARFLIEAEVTGRLEHPGIVPVYSLGTYEDGRPYYAMRFIQGDSLKEAIEKFHEEKKSLTPGERALRLRQLLGRLVDTCDAIAYAHSRGVVHRDIKPANVMVGRFGETLVVDWGLARLMDETDTGLDEAEVPVKHSQSGDSSLTQTGTILGTPAFMAPEQAAGELDKIGPPSDVYSLGATLYVLIAGEIPFQSGNVLDLLVNVREGRFPRPREVNPDIAKPLEAICLKAMALNLEDRYPSALDLKEDIEHWLADEPVTAHQPSTTERIKRWARHHRTFVGVGIAINLIALIAFVIGFVLVSKQQQQTAAAKQKEEKARGEAQEQARKLERQLYSTKVTLALEKLQQKEFGQAGRFLDECNEKLRGWEWHYLNRLQRIGKTPTEPFAEQDRALYAVAISPDGKFVASAGLHGEVWINALHTGKLVKKLTIAPAVPPFFVNRLPKTNRLRLLAENMGTSTVTTLRFSPDGKYLAAGVTGTLTIGKLSVWEVGGDWNRRYELGALKAGVISVDWSPDGKYLVSTGFSNEIALRDPKDGKVLRTMKSHEDIVGRAAFSPEGRYLATIGLDGRVALWDYKAGKLVRRLKSDLWNVFALCFSADGEWVAAGDIEGKAQVWEVKTGKSICTLNAHMGYIFTLAITKKPRRLITTGFDNVVRIWNPRTGETILEVPGHRDSIRLFAQSTDRNVLASVAPDRTVRIWDATPLTETEKNSPRLIARHDAVILNVGCHPDGIHYVTVGRDRRIHAWNLKTGKKEFTYRGHAPDAFIWPLKYSPDGKWIATGDTTGVVHVWNARTGADHSVCRSGAQTCIALDWSPDGKQLAIAGTWKGEFFIWDVDKKKTVRTIQAHVLPVESLAWSPDGSRIASGSQDGLVNVWDAKSRNKEPLTLPWKVSEVLGLRFSPDGKRLAAVGTSNVIRLWNLETEEPTARDLKGRSLRMSDVSFSDDGRYLVTASSDGTVSLWDVQSGEVLKTLYSHKGLATRVRFRPGTYEVITTGGYRNSGEAFHWKLSELGEFKPRE